MYTLLVIVQLLVGLALIALVLMQHGKGADAGAAFGSGASGTVFGARGAASFLQRATSWLAFVFFAISLALAYLIHADNRSDGGSLMDQYQGSEAVGEPTVPTPPPSELPPAAEPAGPKIPD